MNQRTTIESLKQQMQLFLNQLDALDPSQTSVDDVDALLLLLEQMEEKLR
ncbi:hypothetical protein SAMN04488134_11077 [Amphibacillus marinus]|uniref:Uncharacterized protein n=1 Tax=Amphibacillus marinus TaxID=872970 RepID=A0A1H8RG32_9BACI|nr:SE1561 family protein [Amphibacillus marinus]SEO65360.1 hypothetical protein SAMN04488134_11077 [Amphibacillus marinus]